MNSGTLVTNDAVTFAGNRIVLNNSSYTMTDGISISGNTVTDYGGGVQVNTGGTITGAVAPYTDTEKAHTTKEKHYLMVKEDDGISFHRYNVQVKDYYFRLGFDENDPDDTGSAMINFSTAVQGDSKVAAAITGLELSSTPDDGNPATTTSASSSLADLKTTLGAGNPYIHRSNFIFLSNPYTAQYALEATLSMTLNDGTPLTATTPTKNRTLRDILSYFYDQSTTTDAQKATINAFLTKYNLGAISS